MLYGGRSVEHDISIRSAVNVYNYLDKTRFEPILVGITKKGRWFLQNSVEKAINTADPVTPDFSSDNPSLISRKSNQSSGFDVVFPVLHGTDGEDGSIQGLFTALNTPVVGSDVLGSATAMNKLIAKQLLTQNNIPNTKYLYYHFSDKSTIDFDHVNEVLGMPVIVKPVNLGSSVGVSKASDRPSFMRAIEDTFSYDNGVLIEEFVQGREFEIAILGNREPEATVPGEVIVSPDYEFYDFNAKYVDADGATTEIPAKLDTETIDRVKKEAIRAYRALQCCDYSRVDFFVDNSGEIFINEINTIPGFTNISMFPKLWEYEGLDNTALISKLIDLSVQRFQEKNRITTDFESGLK